MGKFTAVFTNIEEKPENPSQLIKNKEKEPLNSSKYYKKLFSVILNKKFKKRNHQEKHIEFRLD